MKNILAKVYKAMHFPKNIQLFIMRFFQDKFLIGVTGIIFNEKQEILLFKHTYRSQAWSLPGGYLKSGEHPREALEREIKEESGLTVSVDESLKTRTDRDSARVDMCYTGVLIGGDFTPTHEVSEYGFFAQDKLPLLRKNQVILIDDALSRNKYLTTTTASTSIKDVMTFMKKFIALLLLVLLQFVFMPVQVAHAATSPSLGNAASFAVLAGTAITNVPTSVITGDVGISPGAGSNITGLTTAEVSGTIYAPDASGPAGVWGNDPALMTSAKNDLVTAYDGLSAAPNVACDVTYAGTKDLTGAENPAASGGLAPGVYCAGAFTLTGALTLNAADPADVWIFRSADTLITSPGSSVVFAGAAASPCNVWWKVASSATIDTTTAFIGNILALTSITMNTGATLQGRALARNGAVTLQSNTINQSCVGLLGGVNYRPPLTSGGGSSSSSCPPLASTVVAPTITESRRVSPTSVFLSWGPYSGSNTFNVRYGTTNGNWQYSTNVTGFSTTIGNLPANTPIWVEVAVRSDCAVGSYGAPKLVGGPGLPNTGFAPGNNNVAMYISAGILITISTLLVLAQKKYRFLSRH